jgi:hypothetical protein
VLTSLQRVVMGFGLAAIAALSGRNSSITHLALRRPRLN